MRISLVVVVSLILSSSISVVGGHNQTQISHESLSLCFQEPCIIDDGKYVKVEMQGAAACVYRSGKPVLPMYTTTLQLPFGSTIKEVNIDFTEVHAMQLPKKIVPAPYPTIEGVTPDASSVLMDEKLYNSTVFYPEQWMTYSTGGGLNEQSTHVTFLTIQVYPVQYSPSEDTLFYLKHCQISYTYEPPTHSPFPSSAIYNMVIITPAQFVLPLQRLAEHKNLLGVHTQITTLREIYQQYPGHDRPEQIKYFIKHAIETWGITYVLLVGGLKSHLAGRPRDDINEGTRDWYLPVRYANLWDIGEVYDPGFISDLYYADIYDGQGSYSSWDSSNDGVYGGWSNPSYLSPPSYPTDQIDFYPDVYLGRLPCRNIFEVSSIVRKIIAYEEKPADSSWFKKMVVAAGDPYDDQGTNYNEGELIGEKALSYMPGFQPQRLYASYLESDPENTPLSTNIIREISAGCGFLFFDGHGSPAWWNTNWPGEFDALIKKGGLTIYQFPQLRNDGRLPICVVGGCHCSQCNVTVTKTITDLQNDHSMWSYGLPIPECWSWSLTVKPKGGAIATIGSTGLGYEAGGEVGDLNGDNLNEPDCVEALGGYLEIQFFKAYGINHTDILGNAWCAAIDSYLDIYPGMQNRSDAKTIEQWILFGDPSLKIGGYFP
jgi:Peptidase family C25/Propeptide_C25